MLVFFGWLVEFFIDFHSSFHKLIRVNFYRMKKSQTKANQSKIKMLLSLDWDSMVQRRAWRGQRRSVVDRVHLSG